MAISGGPPSLISQNLEESHGISQNLEESRGISRNRVPARVLHRGGEEADGAAAYRTTNGTEPTPWIRSPWRYGGAAAQRRCAGRILGHRLEVVVPDVRAAAALVVLVLAHVAGVGCVEDLRRD